MKQVDEQQVAAALLDTIRLILSRSGHPTDGLTLGASVGPSLGLASLDWAEVVVRLEQALGYDPFQLDVAPAFQTLQDIVSFYVSAAPR